MSSIRESISTAVHKFRARLPKSFVKNASDLESHAGFKLLQELGTDPGTPEGHPQHLNIGCFETDPDTGVSSFQYFPHGSRCSAAFLDRLIKQTPINWVPSSGNALDPVTITDQGEFSIDLDKDKRDSTVGFKIVTYSENGKLDYQPVNEPSTGTRITYKDDEGILQDCMKSYRRSEFGIQFRRSKLPEHFDIDARAIIETKQSLSDVVDENIWDPAFKRIMTVDQESANTLVRDLLKMSPSNVVSHAGPAFFVVPSAD